MFEKFSGINQLSNNELKQYIDNLNLDEWKPDTVYVHHTNSNLSDWNEQSLDEWYQYYSTKYGLVGPHFFVSEDFWYILFNPAEKVPINNGWNIFVIINGDENCLDNEQAKTVYRGVATLLDKIGGNPFENIVFQRECPNILLTTPGVKVNKSNFVSGVYNSKDEEYQIEVYQHSENSEEVPIYYGIVQLEIKGIRIDGITFVDAAAIGHLFGFVPIMSNSRLINLQRYLELLNFTCIWDGEKNVIYKNDAKVRTMINNA